MQTVTGQRYFETRSFSSLLGMLRQCADLYQDKPAFLFHDKPGGAEISRSYRNLLSDVEALGTSLQSLVSGRCHSAIYGDNSYDWMISYLAAISGGHVVVPLDKLLPEREVAILLWRGDVNVLFFGAKHWGTVQSLAVEHPGIKYFICMENYASIELPDGDPRFLLLSDLLQKGHELLQTGSRDFLDLPVDTSLLAALLFTSGTTAQAKGVMLSQDNICGNIKSITGVLRISPGERVLSILPLHHSFENTVGALTILYLGGCICYCDGLRYIQKNMQEWKINVMVSVPLLFENIYKKIIENINATGKAQQVALMRPIVRALRRIGIDVRRQVFRKVIDNLGGGLNMVVIGAAAIDKSIIQAFSDFGIKFYMGYGLTEASPCIASCNDRLNIPGSVGVPIAEVEVAIDTPDSGLGAVGEILTRSTSVMLGYYQDPDATRDVLRPDGWLRTGDMGFLDRRGAIYLTGRAKSMIVLSNGKKAFPEEIETLLFQIPGLTESIVWGEPGERDNIDICALLHIDRNTLPLPPDTAPSQISVWLSDKLKEINHDMPTYKAIRYFLFTDTDLVKTTTLKIKRSVQLDLLHKKLADCQMNMRNASGRQLETLE